MKRCPTGKKEFPGIRHRRVERDFHITFVPAEWIKAHGLEPKRLVPAGNAGEVLPGQNEGICPFAESFFQEAADYGRDETVIITTTCDQMRRITDEFRLNSDRTVFLFNVPFTGESENAFNLYLGELKRLGHFLEKRGGTGADKETLIQIMLEYDEKRRQLRSLRRRLSPKSYAAVLARFHAGDGIYIPAETYPCRSGLIPVALLGGPLPESGFWLFDAVEKFGGRIVLDATATGERTLPRPFDPQALQSDPLRELAAAYWKHIPDVFQRPNRRLYQWLQMGFEKNPVSGTVFRNYIWCDLWRIEFQRFREWSGQPALHIDATADEESVRLRNLTRIEAFMEILK